MSESTRSSRPRKPKSKPARSCRVSPANEAGRRLLTIFVGTGPALKTFAYMLEEVVCDFGRGFSLDKMDGEAPYSVHLDSTGDSCTCLGHLRHGHKTVCKHIGAVKTLIANGRL